MKELRKRVAWAKSRNATMANLFENLARVYGGAEAMKVASPDACKIFPGGSVTHEDALRFTNLAAEALINEMDLLKGERVLVMTMDGGEGFLLASAVIKAGGIVVPVLSACDDEELAYLVRSCGVNVALVRTRLLEGHPRLREALGGKVRLMEVGQAPQAGEDAPTLYQALEGAGGFFLPYTLKPGNPVLLCGVGGCDGPMRAVMVTNRGLMSPARLLSPLLPARVGDLCLVCSPPEKPSLFAAVVLALAAGMRLRFLFSHGTEELQVLLEEERPAAILGDPRCLCELAQMYPPAGEHASPKLWLSAGLLGEEAEASLRPLREQEVPGRRHWLVETFTAGEHATIAGLRISRGGRRSRVTFPCMALPPNRVRHLRADGTRAGRGEEGELVVRGPAVTPGYWNDLETTFRNWREGWLHTGLRGKAGPCGIPGNEPS